MENLKFSSDTKFNEDRRCPYCKKPYKMVKIKLPFAEEKFIMVPQAQCDCEDKARIKKEAEMHKKAIQEKVKKIFDNSLMSPFFKEKTFDRLIPNEHLDFCKKYASEFKPGVSKGLQFIGEIGTGKTTSLAAICNDLMNRGYTCLFVTMSELLAKFAKYSYDNCGDVSGLLKWLVKFDFIVLDDIGRESHTDRKVELAFLIVDTLMNSKVTTAITANPEMLGKLKSKDEMSATIDRLREMCPISREFNGESFRGKA